MPRSDPGQQAQVVERREVFWRKLERWLQQGEWKVGYREVSFEPVPLIEELARRDHMATLDSVMLLDEFYKWEIDESLAG